MIPRNLAPSSFQQLNYLELDKQEQRTTDGCKEGLYSEGHARNKTILWKLKQKYTANQKATEWLEGKVTQNGYTELQISILAGCTATDKTSS